MELTNVKIVRKYIQDVDAFLSMSEVESRFIRPPCDLTGYLGWLCGNARKIMKVPYDSSLNSLSSFFFEMGIRTRHPRVFNDLRSFVVSVNGRDQNGFCLGVETPSFICSEEDLVDNSSGVSILDAEESLLLGCSQCFRVVEQDLSLRPKLESFLEREMFLYYMSLSTRCTRCRPLYRLNSENACKRMIERFRCDRDFLLRHIKKYNEYRSQIEHSMSYYECCQCHGLLPAPNVPSKSSGRSSEHRRRMFSTLVRCRSCVVYLPFLGLKQDLYRCRFIRDNRILEYEKWYEDIKEYSLLECEYESVKDKILRSHVFHYSQFFLSSAMRTFYYELVVNYSHVIKVVSGGFRFGSRTFLYESCNDIPRVKYRKVDVEKEAVQVSEEDSKSYVESFRRWYEESIDLPVPQVIIDGIEEVKASENIVACPMNSYGGSSHYVVVVSKGRNVCVTLESYFKEFMHNKTRVTELPVVTQFRVPRSFRY